ncbi:MAG: hypothetical protein AB2748_23165, partial [Candidatus Thiodiazotropha endolucinida]
MIFTEPPEKIYLQYYGDDEFCDGPVSADEVSWCWERVFNRDIEYVKSPSDPGGSIPKYPWKDGPLNAWSIV